MISKKYILFIDLKIIIYKYKAFGHSLFTKNQGINKSSLIIR